VVKANAYGHGDIQVSRAAISAGADALAVALLDEAIKLRH
jgi:alanine racemase